MEIRNQNQQPNIQGQKNCWCLLELQSIHKPACVKQTSNGEKSNVRYHGLLVVRDVTDCFDIFSFAATVDESPDIRSEINNICGIEKTASVKPVLNILYENAKNNSQKSKSSYQHNDTVMDFAISLKCLVGTSGYEFIQTNLGNALPHVSTVNRRISQPIKEGEFLFQDVKRHFCLNGFAHLTYIFMLMILEFLTDSPAVLVKNLFRPRKKL